MRYAGVSPRGEHSQQRPSGHIDAVVMAGPRLHPQKCLGWTGVRERRCGRWAVEIRIPRTRLKLWIGGFQDAQQAALAYDAAMFCFYGERLPTNRRFNFPAIPRPSIPNHVREQLTVDNVKTVAANYGRSYAGSFTPVVCPTLPAEMSPPPPKGLTAATDGTAVTGGAEADAIVRGHHFSNEKAVDGGLMANAECAPSCNPTDFVGFFGVDDARLFIR